MVERQPVSVINQPRHVRIGKAQQIDGEAFVRERSQFTGEG